MATAHDAACPRCGTPAPTDCHNLVLCPWLSDDDSVASLRTLRRAIANGWDEVEALAALTSLHREPPRRGVRRRATGDDGR